MKKSISYSPVARGTVLDNILAKKAEAVRFLEGKTFPVRKRRSPVSLAAALRAPGPGFIFECKKASPGLGDISPKADLEKLAKLYSQFGAAVSVLTEEYFFKGSIDDLRLVGEKTNLPLLAKDFFIHPAQIKEAYSAGADAILLMLSVLDDDTYKNMAAEAERMGLSVLTEVHNKDEMVRANALGAKIIGINNRNLKTLEVEIATTEELAPLARRGTVIVSESGFSNRRQVLRCVKMVHGFLIGGSLMGAERPDLKIRELAVGEVKICGFTNSDDARLSFEKGAIYGGLNFVEGTPRRIEPGEAGRIIKDLPLKWVGVFRNAEVSYISAVAGFLGLSAVQLHGSEDEKFRGKLRRVLPGEIEIWQAVEGPKYSPKNTPKTCDRVLLDSKRHKIFGGTGHMFGWGRLKSLKEKDHLGLAGGLNPANVKKAVRTGVSLLDVCTGVELSPGVKNPEKIKAFFKNIREFQGGYYG